MRKRWLCLLTALIFTVSTFVMMPVQSMAATEQAMIKGNASGGFDLGIANDEKLIKMLKGQGVIAANASPEDSFKALQKYLNNKATSAMKSSAQKGGLESILGSMVSPNNMNGFLSGKGLKKGQTTGTLKPAIAETLSTVKMTDNILVLLVDFPDYHTGDIQPSETDLFYENYPPAYYENMMFGASGFKSPEGQTLISMKQFFEAQSGGSYTVTGTVSNWFTASQPAAYYGGNEITDQDIEDGITDPNLYTGSDLAPRALVEEALANLAKDKKFDFSKFDANGDMVIDHIMVMHAGPGEEAGGGGLANNAIWSHSWGWNSPVTIPGTKFKALNYTIQPEDAATGVCAHEFGHDLGLPDEYDTAYSGSGEPVSYWSIMSSGSWAGKIPGTEPTGFSPYGKLYFQSTYGGNWIKGSTIDLSAINKTGVEVILDQASMKGTKDDVLVITLPDKTKKTLAPFAGNYSYFSGSENDMASKLSIDIDLTNATTASIDFTNWFQIEEGYDYLHYQVKAANASEWTDLLVTDAFSNGWEQQSYDLSAYAGQQITFRALYVTDGGYLEAGVYLDNIHITVDGTIIKTYDAEDGLNLADFTANSGFVTGTQYYIIEWRNQTGVDQGLGHIVRGNDMMSYDPGLVIWYVDNTYTDNFVGVHPGNGYIGVVDADQSVLRWNGNIGVASTKYQLHDAAFKLSASPMMSISYPADNMLLVDNQNGPQPLFADSSSYISSQIPDAGKLLPNFGIKVRVSAVSSDKSAAKIYIYK